MFYALAIVPSVYAAEPSEPTIADDGTVASKVFVEADPATVRQMLADPLATAALNPDIISVRVVSHGTCDVVEVTTRGLTTPLSYMVKRCATATGYTESMVSSDDFDGVDVSWKVEAAPGGSTVSYSVRTLPDLPVPQRLVSLATAKSAVAALKNLVHRVTGK